MNEEIKNNIIDVKVDDILQKLENMENLFSKESIYQKELWNTDDIAQYFQLHRTTIHTKIIKQIDFPNAIKLPTCENGGFKRWYSKDIKTWAAKYKAKNYD